MPTEEDHLRPWEPVEGVLGASYFYGSSVVPQARTVLVKQTFLFTVKLVSSVSIQEVVEH